MFGRPTVRPAGGDPIRMVQGVADTPVGMACHCRQYRYPHAHKATVSHLCICGDPAKVPGVYWGDRGRCYIHLEVGAYAIAPDGKITPYRTCSSYRHPRMSSSYPMDGRCSWCEAFEERERFVESVHDRTDVIAGVV